MKKLYYKYLEQKNPHLVLEYLFPVSLAGLSHKHLIKSRSLVEEFVARPGDQTGGDSSVAGHVNI